MKERRIFNAINQIMNIIVIFLFITGMIAVLTQNLALAGVLLSFPAGFGCGPAVAEILE